MSLICKTAVAYGTTKKLFDHSKMQRHSKKRYHLFVLLVFLSLYTSNIFWYISLHTIYEATFIVLFYAEVSEKIFVVISLL